VVTEPLPEAAPAPPEPAPTPTPVPPAPPAEPAATPPPATVFAIDDAVTTAGRPLRIRVLDNDGAAGVTLDPSTLEIVEGPAHAHGNPGGSRGTVGSDGIIPYLAEAGFVGVDTITYRICSTAGVCQLATVTITVTE
jgi:hypothetical protein